MVLCVSTHSYVVDAVSSLVSGSSLSQSSSLYPSSCSHGYLMTLSILRVVKAFHLIALIPSALSFLLPFLFFPPLLSTQWCSLLPSFPPFLHPLLVLLFLHTCRGWQPGRSWQAGCHGNSKQVAAGYWAGEERRRRGSGKACFWTFKWVRRRPPSSPSDFSLLSPSLRASLRSSWMALTDSWYVSR